MLTANCLECFQTLRKSFSLNSQYFIIKFGFCFVYFWDCARQICGLDISDIIDAIVNNNKEQSSKSYNLIFNMEINPPCDKYNIYLSNSI